MFDTKYYTPSHICQPCLIFLFSHESLIVYKMLIKRNQLHSFFLRCDTNIASILVSTFIVPVFGTKIYDDDQDYRINLRNNTANYNNNLKRNPLLP